MARRARRHFQHGHRSQGDKLYVTWNVDRGDTRTWDCCALTVIHIPEPERQP